MNKKKLSVVMAGAMLATSVAPVLAAEVTPETMGSDQRGLVMEGIRNLMKSKMLDGTTTKDDSAYGFTIVPKGESDKNADGTIKNLHNVLGDIDTYIKTIKDTDEKTIRVYEKETRINEFGKLTDTYKKGTEIPGTEITAKVSDLETLKNATYTDNEFVDTVEYVEGTTADKGIKITLNVSVDASAGSEEKKTITLLPGEKLLDLKDPRDKENYKLDIAKKDDVQKFDHFAVATTASTPSAVGTEVLPGRTLVQEINLVKAADVKDAYKVEDLFDGLMLTEKGVELLETLKADETGKDLDYTYKAVSNLLPGIYGFNIEVTDKNATNPTKVIKTITVRGLDKDNFDILSSWIQKKKFNVGVLAGANRYETAAKIAKEQADLTSVATAGNLVLVNGEALVDGLSAAPLAWSLGKAGSGKAAPILLTKSDALPKETKEYLRELVKTQTIQGLEDITVHIVGGEAVVTESVVEELEDYGFKVKRHGGENRDETSLEVLEQRKPQNVYVVGADGEADAMSIAPVASSKTGAIVVAKKGGLSKAAFKAIERSNANITIVGGEAAISAEEEAKLKEIAKENKKTIERVSGVNRQATNAAIMKKFYTFSNTSNVVVAKDGQKKKMDLVDALTAANLASQKKAPVVLATDKLSNDQLNEVNKLANNVEAIYQIGHGVEVSVVAKLAELLGLPKVIK